jgi:hypothetical protein
MISLILLVAAFVLFVLAGIGLPPSRYNLIGFGLACWVLSEILGRGALLH